MVPFPPVFEVPKFHKYKGRVNPMDHVKEFNFMCMEVAYNDSYLMHLFPRSLTGPTMDRLSQLPLRIKTFQEIIDRLIDQFVDGCFCTSQHMQHTSMLPLLKGRNLQTSYKLLPQGL